MTTLTTADCGPSWYCSRPLRSARTILLLWTRGSVSLSSELSFVSANLIQRILGHVTCRELQNFSPLRCRYAQRCEGNTITRVLEDTLLPLRHATAVAREHAEPFLHRGS